MPIIDLTAQKFGRWTVVSYSHKDSAGAKWNCKCECGGDRIVYGFMLKSGRSTSCGCFKRDMLCKKSKGNTKRRIDLTGQRFGLLTVQKISKTEKGFLFWECVCDCGGSRAIKSHKLRGGDVTHCGCNNRELHGDTSNSNNKYTKEYMAWLSMKARCYDKNTKNYKDYGGRGITVCDRWKNSYVNFLSDVGRAPTKNHSLDRWPDNENGNYEPSNFRWATPKQQSGNRRSNVWLEFQGKKMILQDWAHELSVSCKIISSRLKKMPFHDVVYNIKNNTRA